MLIDISSLVHLHKDILVFISGCELSKLCLSFSFCVLATTLYVERSLDIVYCISVIRIHRAALWILGEFCTTSSDIQGVMTLIRQSLGEVAINN